MASISIMASLSLKTKILVCVLLSIMTAMIDITKGE